MVSRAEQAPGTHPRRVPRVAPWTCPLLRTVPCFPPGPQPPQRYGFGRTPDSGCSLGNDGPRSVPDDGGNHGYGCGRGHVRDCVPGNSVHNAGRNRSRCRLNSRGSCGGSSPGNCVPDNPPNDGRDYLPDEGPDDGPDNFADDSGGNPLSGGVSFALSGLTPSASSR